MRKLLCAITVLFFSTTLLFGQNDYSNALYKSKVQKFGKMKRTGTALTILGGVMTTAGIILISNADWEEETTTSNGYYSQNNTNQTSSDPNAVLGIFGVLLGVPVTTTGIIFRIIGSKKEKEYQNKLDNISLGYFNKHNANGVTLRIKL